MALRFEIPTTRRGRLLFVLALAAFAGLWVVNGRYGMASVTDNRWRCSSLPVEASTPAPRNYFDRFDEPSESYQSCMGTELNAYREAKRAAWGVAFLGTIVEMALFAGLFVIGKRVVRWILAGEKA